MEDIKLFLSLLSLRSVRYIFIYFFVGKCLLETNEAKKKPINFRKKNDSRVRSSGRKNEALSEKGVKKSASGSCPVDFWCSKLPSLLRLSFKGGFDR